LKDDELRDRLRDSLLRIPAAPAPNIEGVYSRARRLTVRRRVVGSVIALGVAAAFAVPLALLLPLEGSDEAPSGSAPPPDVAQVVCEPSGPRVLTPVVRPQLDGVHVRVRNTFDEAVAIGLRAVSGGGQGDGGPPGVFELIFSVAPGDLVVTCSPGEADHGDPRWQAPMGVVDPEGIFVPYALECGGKQAMAGIFDYVSGATGPRGDPVEIARDSIEGLSSTDGVERAGYPSERRSTDEAIVRVVHEGRVVLTIHYRSDGQGGWLEDTRESCASDEIR
jgi:hypothetical protein